MNETTVPETRHPVLWEITAIGAAAGGSASVGYGVSYFVLDGWIATLGGALVMLVIAATLSVVVGTAAHLLFGRARQGVHEVVTGLTIGVGLVVGGALGAFDWSVL